jgi:hypothetical protein
MERKLKTSFRIYFPLSTSGLYTISDHKLFIYVFRNYRCLTVMDVYQYFAEITLLRLCASCIMVLNQDCGTTETETDLTRDSFSMSGAGSRFGLTQIVRYLQTLLSTDPKLILTKP